MWKLCKILFVGVVLCGPMLLAEDAPEAQAAFQQAQAKFDRGDYRAAAKAFGNVAEDYPMAEQLAESAQFMEAESFYLADRLDKAYKRYQQLLRDFPRTPYYDQVLQREYEIGDRFCSGFKRRLLGMRIVGSGTYGTEVLETVIRHAPRSALAEKARLRIAQYYFDTSDYTDSSRVRQQCDLFLREYPDSPLAPEARWLRAMAADMAVRGARYNAGDFDRAETELLDAQSIDRGADTEERLDDALARLRDKELENTYLTAKFYLREGRAAAAAICLNSLIDRAPDSQYARYAREGLAQLNPSGAEPK